MYCIKCGVELADTEKSCPLCQTKVCHPDLEQPDATPLYPSSRQTPKSINRWNIMLILTILYLLPVSICLVCDLAVTGKMEWSGYVIGGLLIFYSACLMPQWFRNPNPVIFTPITFGIIIVYLLYIEQLTGGNWFLTFAFPVAGAVGLITTAVVTLCRYIRKGRLYIFGGAVISLGLLSLLIEFLMSITFHFASLFSWSLYPLITLTLLGLAMIVTAIFRPLRETLEKKFFL